MSYQSFFDIDMSYFVPDEKREEDVSSFEIRLLSLEYHKDDKDTVEYSETNENRPSYTYQINKIRATKKYIDEVKIPEVSNNWRILQTNTDAILTMIKAINKFMKVFRLGEMSWAGLDIVKIADFLNILTTNLREYLDMKEQYYELIPTRDIFSQERIDYELDDIPDEIKKRHRDIGVLRAKVLNDNRKQTYDYIAGLREARAYLSTAIAIANEYSSKYREFQAELNERTSEIQEFRDSIDEIRTALIVAGPLIARLASPTSDGKVATIHSSIVSILGEIVALVDKIMMYFNYYTGVNIELEEYLRKSRDFDSLCQEQGVVI